ncbi:RNA polymerase sigma factor [Methylophilus sp. OH31]|uniref:RNA polymerase sigma factor n=1 Tax=Methylophilus sp. OH31 TaxID=1387312 RepID=UPI00056BF263|nr:RNA polymerase sigma factor [Methylophilus sp. OH31]
MIGHSPLSHQPKYPSLLHALTTHYDDLIDYVRRKFGGREFAQDVVHDLCVKLIERPILLEIQQPLAYLRKASANGALNRIRGENLRAEFIDVVEELPDYAHTESGEYLLALKQNVISLHAVIEGLPPRARQVFLLHRLYDFSQQEIAKELEISRTMVTQHYRRAIREIAEKWPPLQQYYESRWGSKL